MVSLMDGEQYSICNNPLTLPYEKSFTYVHG
jgi:hypothetical protein